MCDTCDDTYIDDRVAAGVMLLDDRRPDWRTLVDVSRLNIADGDWCVLGQVFPEQSYGDALEELGLDSSPWEYGFDARGSEYEALRRAWIGVITTAQ